MAHLRKPLAMALGLNTAVLVVETMVGSGVSLGCGAFAASGGFGQGVNIGSGGHRRGGNVPEPATLLLLGSGLAGLAAWRRKLAA